MMEFNPLVSIVIPVYNGSNYMREAIDSALSQTYRNIEVLVINDGSTDGGKTEEIARTYGDKIRYFDKVNGGVATALNVGIREMRGAYFSWLSHDDVYYPEKICTQIEYLKKQTNKNIVLYSDFTYVDEKFNIKQQIILAEYPPEMFRPVFIQGGFINGCTLLIPKICFKVSGLFSTELKITQDYDLWFRFSEKYEFHHVPEILIYSRIHKDQDTLKLSDIRSDEANLLYIDFLKKIKRAEIRKFSKKNHSGYYANFSLRMSDFQFLKAKKYALRLAILNLPFSKFKELPNNLFLIVTLIENKIIKRFFKILKILSRKLPFQNNMQKLH
jgi:glycosyltransferase involved in cell wall biosynthesis